MNTAEMPTTQDARIEAAFGQPLAVLYARAQAGTAQHPVDQVLELRSFLAVVEGHASAARERLHQATDPRRGGLYDMPLQDLRFQTDLLEAALGTGRRYGRAVAELLAGLTRDTVPVDRPALYAKAAEPPAPAAEPAAVPETIRGEAVGAGTGRHRR
ncbi:hypothetical protein VSR01_28220 [Actinacidiphila sp. DG2A-62]|jgi:hypothetical protein|uniref:hypothetical protein n=1 Tax=Actinacidiphila sp. DG2A-62 TaxID=3108821 RepID=UPI002DBBF792|nr:hypothetical protein [Actinacidiphila sp. DG2A-62]MEC3997178.1 hypothetical protein [Actinacidiphila sp. DG2A-62]